MRFPTGRVLALACAVAISVAAPAGAQSAATVSTTPGLDPAFDPGVPNYVTRCEPGGRVTFDVTAPPGDPVAVDGAAPRTGTFSVDVALGAGQRAGFQVGEGAAARTYAVRCLPENFPAYTVQRTGATQAAYYLVTPTLLPLAPPYVAMFDGNGVPVWWVTSPPNTLPNDFKLLPDGNLAWHVSKDLNPNGVSLSYGDRFEEHRLDGSLVRTIRSLGGWTDFHELQQLANGNYLVLSYRPREDGGFWRWGVPWPVTVLDGVVQEVTPSGVPVWQWSTNWHLDLDEARRWADTNEFLKAIPGGKLAADWRHVNAFEPDGDGLLVSVRHSDAIYRVSRATGDVEWKLGGTRTSKSLTIVGDANAAADFGGQHDVRRLPDGTITLFDNGTRRDRLPRALRFRVDPAARTATLLESVTDPEAQPSFCCGSARKLTGGDWVVDWVSLGAPLISELRPDGTPVLRLAFEGRFSYRANPLEPGRLDPAAVQAGMDAMHPRP